MATRPKYGGEALTTIGGKRAGLRDFLDDKIDEVTETLDQWDPDLFQQIQDTLPPVGPFESEREHAAQALETLKEDRSTLETIQSRWERVSEIRETLQQYQHETRERIDDERSDIYNQISQLQSERDRLETERRRLDRTLDSLRQSLETEQTGPSRVVLPIDTDALDELSSETAPDTLTSIAAYVEHGLVSTDRLGDALDLARSSSEAWTNHVLDRDMSDTDQNPEEQSVQERWFWFHESAANADLTETMDEPVKADIERIAGKELRYSSDPYHIQLVSFYRAGPVSALTLYQQLEGLAAEGAFESMETPYADYRQAFAYPEWYHDDISNAFEQ